VFKFSDKPQTITDVLRDSLEIYKHTILQVWYWAAVVPLLSALPVFLGGTPTKTAAFTVQHIFFMAFTLVVAAYFMSLILHRIYKLATARNPAISESLQLARNKWLTVFLAMLLTTAISFIGFLFFIVPGIFLSILFMFYLPLILFDGMGVFDAIKGSCQLVWGHWWFTFALIFIPTLLLVFLTLLFMTLFGKENAFLTTVFDVVVLTIVTPFLQAVILTQFNNLKLQQTLVTTHTK